MYFELVNCILSMQINRTKQMKTFSAKYKMQVRNFNYYAALLPLLPLCHAHPQSDQNLTSKKSLHIDPVQTLPLQHSSITVHQDVGVILDIYEHLIHPVSHALLPGDGQLAHRLLDGI